LILKFFIVYWI